jgi:hypothetical protein
MITQETYTKIFLKAWDKSIDAANLKLYSRTWWQNNRIKDTGGLRLTDKGYEFLVSILELREYEIPFTEPIELSPQTIIFLDRFIDCPYYLTDMSITVFSEKKSFELMLFSDDIRKFGIIKAINNLKKSEEDLS